MVLKFKAVILSNRSSKCWRLELVKEETSLEDINMERFKEITSGVGVFGLY